MALKPTVKDVLNIGEAALKAGGKVVSKLKPLGTALTVISTTMSAVTVVGWLVSRRIDKKKKAASDKK